MFHGNRRKNPNDGRRWKTELLNVIKRTNVWTEIHRSSFAIVTNWIVFRFKGIKRAVRLETCEPPAARDANILKHQRQTDSTSPVI